MQYMPNYYALVILQILQQLVTKRAQKRQSAKQHQQQEFSVIMTGMYACKGVCKCVFTGGICMYLYMIDCTVSLLLIAVFIC